MTGHWLSVVSVDVWTHQDEFRGVDADWVPSFAPCAVKKLSLDLGVELHAFVLVTPSCVRVSSTIGLYYDIGIDVCEEASSIVDREVDSYASYAVPGANAVGHG